MNKPRTIEGRWWIFGLEKDPHFGALAFDPEDGCKLEIKMPQQVSFEDVIRQTRDQWKVSVPRRIHGRDKHGAPVVLFGCYCHSHSVSAGLATYEISAIRALLGCVDSHEEPKFDSAYIDYSLLHQWLGRTSIGPAKPDTKYWVTHSPQPDISADLGDGTILIIHSQAFPSHSVTEFRITEKQQVELKFSKPLPVAAIMMRYVEPFRRMLSLFAGPEVFVDEVFFGAKGERRKAEFVELLEPNRGVGRADRKLIFANALVPYREIESDFPKIVQRWFRYHEQLDAVLNLYFATVFNRHLYSNHEFLFLAQALEVYHARNPNFTRAERPRTEFRQMVKTILSSVPHPLRRWLDEKLRYANEKTLAQRLDDILDRHPSEVATFIPDRAYFTSKVRQTRNYYTHYDEELKRKGKIAEGEELFRIATQMRRLLEISILRDLGIIGTAIRRFINRWQEVDFVSV
jgi:hypothetical protein